MKLLTRQPKFDLQKNERERLVAAAKEMDLIARRFIEINLLRASLADAAQDFISGKLPILEALALGSFRRPDHEDAQRNLVSALKNRRNELLEGCAELVKKLRQHAADVAQAKLDEAEAAERKAARSAGIDDDDFRPSGNLERLAAELHAAKDDLAHDRSPSERDFVHLLAEAGIPAPTTRAAADDD
jgi:hypothetical protein